MTKQLFVEIILIGISLEMRLIEQCLPTNQYHGKTITCEEKKNISFIGISLE